jgi:phosphoribosylaminoimidazole (AIR) synthetase
MHTAALLPSPSPSLSLSISSPTLPFSLHSNLTHITLYLSSFPILPILPVKLQILLAPTVIYVKDLLKLNEAVGVKAAAHITGEGHPGNIPRVLPKGLTARINKDSWKRPEIFNWLQKAGGVSEDEMFATFNMGIGMIVVIDPKHKDKALATLPQATVIGEIVEGTDVVLV